MIHVLNKPASCPVCHSTKWQDMSGVGYSCTDCGHSAFQGSARSMPDMSSLPYLRREAEKLVTIDTK